MAKKGKDKEKDEEGAERPLSSIEKFNPAEFAAEMNKGAKTEYGILLTGVEYEGANIPGYLSLGTSAVDSCIGGGIPLGRISQICGPASSGKSLLLEAACVAAQQRGGAAIILDSEGSFNKARFASAGGRIEDLLFYDNIQNLEDGFRNLNKAVERILDTPSLKGKPVVLGWDTICTDKTRAEVQKGQFGGGRTEAPRVLFRELATLVGAIKGTHIAMMLLNQTYIAQGDDAPWIGCDIRKVPRGGEAPKYYSTVIGFSEEASVYKSPRTNEDGKIMKLTFVKSRSFASGSRVVYVACDGHGVDDTMSMYITLARDLDKDGKKSKWLGNSGAWTYVDGMEDIKWNNEKSFAKRCKDNPNFVDFLAAKMWELFPAPSPVEEKASSAFVAMHKEANPWLEEGKAYVKCAISGHRCEVDVYKACRSLYFASCKKELPDVQPIKRIYHADETLDLPDADSEDKVEE